MKFAFRIMLMLALGTPGVSHGATLTYEVVGHLSQSSNPTRWAAGTPFALRFSYSTDTLQVASIFGDFLAPSVVTTGYFVIGSEHVLTFSDQLLFHSDDPTGFLSFNLFTNINVETEVPLNPTVNPLSFLELSLASPTGFLPDGRLFDETISTTISPFAQFGFIYREVPRTTGSGDISCVRAIPEPAGVILALVGFCATLLPRNRAGGRAYENERANRVEVARLRLPPLPQHPACGFDCASPALRAASQLSVSRWSAVPGGSSKRR